LKNHSQNQERQRAVAFVALARRTVTAKWRSRPEKAAKSSRDGFGLSKRA